jgi:hypothetical protein
MIRLNGHFDGQAVLLDEPPPEELKPNTRVEVLVPQDSEDRALLLQEWERFLADWWSRPIPEGGESTPRWRREDLYERGGKPLS